MMDSSRWKNSAKHGWIAIRVLIRNKKSGLSVFAYILPSRRKSLRRSLLRWKIAMWFVPPESTTYPSFVFFECLNQRGLTRNYSYPVSSLFIFLRDIFRHATTDSQSLEVRQYDKSMNHLYDFCRWMREMYYSQKSSWLIFNITGVTFCASQ